MLRSLLLCLPAVAAADEPFRWSPGSDAIGPVLATGEGWERHGELAWREVPGWAGAATYELLLDPGPGHEGERERALVQVPKLEEGSEPRGLLVAFHTLGRTEREVFLESELPARCAQRGLVLLAPYGLADDSVGTPQSQAATARLLTALQALQAYPHRRVYVAGEGVGGLAALSFAARHQDPSGVRVAGVIALDPVLDLEREFERSGERRRAGWIERFGGTPDEVPFAYGSVRVARPLLGGFIDPVASPIVHLDRVPVFLHGNLASPDTERVDGARELASFLATRGARVVEDWAFDPMPETRSGWSRVPLDRALDCMAKSASIGVPQRMDLLADRPGVYGAVEVVELTEKRHGELHVALGSNTLELSRSVGIDSMAVDLCRVGLVPSEPLTLEWSSADGSVDRVELAGYLARPASVVRGEQSWPSKLWWWDEERHTLVLQLDGDDPVSLLIEP